MAIGGIAAVDPSSFSTQSVAGRRSTLESLLGGIGSFRTALRSLGILGDSAPSIAPSPEGAGTAGIAATALLLAPPSAYAAAEPVDAASVQSAVESGAEPAAASTGFTSPSAYTAAGTPVYRQPATAAVLDFTV